MTVEAMSIYARSAYCQVAIRFGYYSHSISQDRVRALGKRTGACVIRPGYGTALAVTSLLDDSAGKNAMLIK